MLGANPYAYSFLFVCLFVTAKPQSSVLKDLSLGKYIIVGNFQDNLISRFLKGDICLG